MSEQDDEPPPQLPGECLEPPQLTTITDVDKDNVKQEYISAMDRFEGANMDTSTADMSLQSSMHSTSVNPFHPSSELGNVTAVSVEQTPGNNIVSVSPSDEREVVNMDTTRKNVLEPVGIATPGTNSSHTNGNAQIKQSTSSFSGSQEHEGSGVSISLNNENILSANVNTGVGDSVHNVSASMTVDDVAQEVSVSRIPIIRNVSSSESSESPDKNDSPTKFVHLVDDHAETFRNHLHQQWLKAQYCDLALRVKDNEVKVHSCVFSAFSPRGCQNERRKVVFLPDVSYSSVDALVRMMYTGILCFDAGEAAQVLHAAKELMMTEMVTLIQNYINQCPLPDSGIGISQKPSGGLSVSQSATPVQTTSQSGRQKRGRGRPRKSDKSESQSVSTPESVSPKRKRRATTFKDIVPGLSERVLRQHVPKDPPSEEFEIKIETEETDDDDGDETFDETHGTSSEDTIVKQEIMDEEDEDVQEEEGDATETVGRAKECSSSISMNPGRIHDDLDSSKDVHPHGLAEKKEAHRSTMSRRRLKVEDEIKYKEMLAEQKRRSKKQRALMKMELERKNPSTEVMEKKKRQLESQRRRQAKYMAKRKSEAKTDKMAPTPKKCTRKSCQETREYNKLMKQKSRALMTTQEKNLVKKKDRERKKLMRSKAPKELVLDDIVEKVMDVPERIKDIKDGTVVKMEKMDHGTDVSLENRTNVQASDKKRETSRFPQLNQTSVQTAEMEKKTSCFPQLADETSIQAPDKEKHEKKTSRFAQLDETAIQRLSVDSKSKSTERNTTWAVRLFRESKKKSDGCIDVKGMAEDNSSINTFGDDNEDDNGSRKEIGQTSEGSKNKGTEQKTMSNLNTLLSYLREKRHEQRQIHEVPPKELNNHLCQFFTQTKKMNGEEYDPSTLKGMLASFNRHLRKHDYQFCLVKSKEFARLNSLLSSKLLDLKKRFGGKPQNLKADLLTDTEVDLLYETGQLGLNSAKSLIHTVWFNNMICFGVRNFNVHHNLKWGDVQLKTDADGKEYLELIQGMTRNIANVNDFRHETPKMWAKPENPGRCPVSAYKKYREMRPPFCKEPTDPFYLAPAKISVNTKKTQLWFKAYGVGINNLRSFLKDMTTEAGIINVGPHRKRVTDHIAGTYNINGQKSTGTQSGNDNSAAQTKLYQAIPIVIGGKKLQPIRPAVYNINPTIVITRPQVISRPIMPMVNVEPNQTQAQTQAKAQAQGQAQSQARAQAFPIHVVPNESIHERLFGGALNIIPSSQGKN